jgi:multidrug resistance efflux pump
MEALLHRLVLRSDLEDFRQQLDRTERQLLTAEEATDPLEAAATGAAAAAAAAASQGAGSLTQIKDLAGEGVLVKGAVFCASVLASYNDVVTL